MPRKKLNNMAGNHFFFEVKVFSSMCFEMFKYGKHYCKDYPISQFSFGKVLVQQSKGLDKNNKLD